MTLFIQDTALIVNSYPRADITQVLATPLTRLIWWRVCLDEAQLVENGTAAAARLANQLLAVHRCLLPPGSLATLTFARSVPLLASSACVVSEVARCSDRPLWAATALMSMHTDMWVLADGL